MRCGSRCRRTVLVVLCPSTSSGNLEEIELMKKKFLVAKFSVGLRVNRADSLKDTMLTHPTARATTRARFLIGEIVIFTHNYTMYAPVEFPVACK